MDKRAKRSGERSVPLRNVMAYFLHLFAKPLGREIYLFHCSQLGKAEAVASVVGLYQFGNW